MQLAYLGLEVSDLSGWREFGQTILGLMAISAEEDELLAFRMDDYSRRIILEAGSADDFSFAGFALPTLISLDALRMRLVEKGYNPVELSEAELEKRPIRTGFHCTDPFGHRFEYGCGLVTDLLNPFASPTGIRYVAGDLGLGHIVLSAPDEIAATEFYQGVMGLRLSDQISLENLGDGIFATFYHCNQRHHTLATVNVQQPKRLQHFMVQFDSLDDVGRAYDRCLDAGVALATTIGRHTNDKMISFYVVSPSGFAVEVGAGGRMIDDETWVVEYHRQGSFWGHRVVSSDFIEG